MLYTWAVRGCRSTTLEPMWEFPKHQGTSMQTPNSRCLIIRTPTERSPNFVEIAIEFSQGSAVSLRYISPKAL